MRRISLVATTFLLLAGCGSTDEAAVTPDAATVGDADAGANADADTAACPTCGRGLWVWESDVVLDAAARSTFFDFTAEHDVRVVYLHAPGLLSTTNASALASFVSEAKTKCIDVELLFGNASWTKTENHGTAVNYAEAAVEFATTHPTAAPVGVHFDVEPHGLPEWQGSWEANEELVNQYLDLLDKLRAALAGSDLRLSVDIPFWWDGPRQVTRGGMRRQASEFVIDVADVTTLMDYRDTAGEIVSLANEELTYAATVNKLVTVGVETQCGLTPTYVTFCEEGQAALEAELATAQAMIGNNPAFHRFAVHYYRSWRMLQP